MIIEAESGVLHGTVFAKTAAGHAALAGRTAQLSGMQRNLLIVINGKRDVAALCSIVPEQLLDQALLALRELGLIMVPAGLNAVQAAPSAGVSQTTGVAFDAVKRLMVDSAQHYLGPMAGALVQRIDGASDEKQVRSAMGHWHMAMRESKYGRAEINELHARVSTMLNGGAVAHAG